MHAAQLRKKLGVMDPSREERYSKRIKNADDSSNPSPGISYRLEHWTLRLHWHPNHVADCRSCRASRS